MADYNLERFKQAQAGTYGGYATALQEVRQGKKTSHWIWYIFPQLKGLGRTSTSDYYGIVDLNEAKAYLADETLGARLREITQALLEHSDVPIRDIFGQDAIKVRSCMTLFDIVSPHDIFATVLETFFHGSKDELTIRGCNKLNILLRPLLRVLLIIIAFSVTVMLLTLLCPPNVAEKIFIAIGIIVLIFIAIGIIGLICSLCGGGGLPLLGE